ncbi:MAG: hypothetical protein V2A72_04265 [Candidatus Omnitrophota bacterium]
MEKMGGLLILLGVLVIVYALLGAFVGSCFVFSFIRPIKPATALTLANSLLLLGLVVKATKK